MPCDKIIIAVLSGAYIFPGWALACRDVQNILQRSGTGQLAFCHLVATHRNFAAFFLEFQIAVLHIETVIRTVYVS